MGSTVDILDIEGNLDGQKNAKHQTAYLGLSSETCTLAGTGLSVADNHCHNKPNRGNHRGS